MKIKTKLKEITRDNILKDEELHNAIVANIQTDFLKSETYTSAKKTLFLDRDLQTDNLTRKRIIKPNFMQMQKRTFKAKFKNLWLYPTFWSVNYYNEDIANNLNKVAKIDAKIMRKELKDSIMLDHIFDYWPWIRRYDGRTDKGLTSKFKVVDPMTRYPDPQGNVIDNNFEYHLFSERIVIGDIEQEKDEDGENVYFNIDKICKGTWFTEQKKRAKKQARLIFSDAFYNESYYVLNCMITVNGDKYMCTVANAHSLIIRWEKIDKLSKHDIVEFPLSISHRYPLYDDPFGMSMRELIFDNEIAMQKLQNAMLQKEMVNAGFNTYMVDVDVVRNAHLLAQRPEDAFSIMPVNNQWRGLAWVATPFMNVDNTNNTQNMVNYLRNMSVEATWISNTLSGLKSESDTLWQTNIQVEQGNELFSLDADMLSIGEEMFWRCIYYRALKQNLKATATKITEITWFWYSDIIKIKKSDLYGWYDPYITVSSRQRKMEEARNKLLFLQQREPLMAQMQQIPIVMKMIRRDMYRYAWFEEDEILAYEPMDASEMHAYDMMKLINSDEKKKLQGIEFFMDGVDLQTLYIYTMKAVDNDLKKKYLATIRAEMLRQWLQQQPEIPQEWEMWWLVNSQSAQLLAQTNQQWQPQNQMPVQGQQGI